MRTVAAAAAAVRIAKQFHGFTGMSQTFSSRSGDLFVVGALMIVFGGAEVVTGVTQNFFGIATAATYAVGAIGAAYCAAGISSSWVADERQSLRSF